MRIHLIAVGSRTPRWVDEGYHSFAKRLPRECALTLCEVATARRSKAEGIARAVEREGASMRAAVPRGARVVALDERGKQWTTRQLSDKLAGWLQSGQDTALLIGGPDGLAGECRDAAQELWSLSSLTLPHALVRIMVAEQIYRAWSVLQRHPYHRED